MASGKQQAETKKLITRYFTSEFGSDEKIFAADTDEELKMLVRCLGNVQRDVTDIEEVEDENEGSDKKRSHDGTLANLCECMTNMESLDSMGPVYPQEYHNKRHISRSLSPTTPLGYYL